MFYFHTEVIFFKITFGEEGRRTLFGTWFDKQQLGLLFWKEIPLRIMPGPPASRYFPPRLLITLHAHSGFTRSFKYVYNS